MKARTQNVFCSILILCMLGALSACGGTESTPGETGTTGETGDTGPSSLVETEPIEPGTACPHGGLRIHTGLDADANGTLSPDELVAGASSDICRNAAPEDTCGGPLAIAELSGVDQVFTKDVPSAPITAALNRLDGVELHFVGRGFTLAPGATADAFSLTPQMSGGPFDLALVASDGCSVDVAKFRIDQVVIQNTMRAVWLFEPWADVELLETGQDQPLVSAQLREPTTATIIEPGPHTFDIKHDGFVSTTTEPIDFPMGTAASLVAYPLGVAASSSDDLGFLHLEDDMSSPGQAARLRLINMDPSAGAVDIFALGADQPIFSDVDFGVASAATLVRGEDRIGLTLVDGQNRTFDYMLDGPLFAPGTIANIFVIHPGSAHYDPPNLLVQYLDDAATSATGERVLLAPVDFENAAPPFYELPYGICTNTVSDGFPWGYVSTDSYTNTALSHGSANEQKPTSWVEIPVTAPTTGSFSFEWKSEGESDDVLFYCLDASPTSECTETVPGCDPTTNTLALSAESQFIAEWATVTTPVLSPGTHILRFGYAFQGEHRDDPNNLYHHRGFVDNIVFIPASP